MAIAKQIKIQNPSGTGYDSRDIGAEAQYVEVSRDSSGEIIEDITATGVTVDSTEDLSITLKNLEDNKQDNLTFDSAPTQGSTNPVTSNGIYIALQNKADVNLIYNNSSDMWQESHDYNVGDLVIYNNALYKCITEHTSESSFADDYWNSTTIESAINNINSIISFDNAGSHNCVYRGKYLGDHVTQEQYDEIAAGTFKDMYIGDYWIINDITWRIAAFDYWLGYGDRELITHHVVIVPDEYLDSAASMNDSNVTIGGYAGSKMHTDYLATSKNEVDTAFGAFHILKHREYFTDTVTDGYASGVAYYDSTVDLMNESMVYGSDFFTPHNNLGTTIPACYTIDHSQLPLFAHDHSKICNGVAWWLRDVVSEQHFADVDPYGNCDYSPARVNLNVRPVFAITGPGHASLVPWSIATDTEIAAMVNAYYYNELTLEEIQSVWHVGDTCSINIDYMPATDVSESHYPQTVDIVILDFEHDDLTTPINGHTKALISVQLKDCLREPSLADDDGQNNSEHGYMNSTATNVGGWTSSARRAWCNDTFYNAIPWQMKDLIKQVNKLTSAGNGISVINVDADYCWLPSEVEIFGTTTHTIAGEGSQYSYYTTASNRYKLPKWDSSSVSDRWWERSPYTSRESGFCCVSGDGLANVGSPHVTLGLSPAWAL